jgi:hypothetical protein
MRPRFAVEVPCAAETVVRVLRERIGDAEPPLEGHFDVARCVLRPPRERRSLWSPELELTFEPLESGGAQPLVRIRCLFAPRPPVWTGFAFVYALLAASGLAGALYGLAQLTLGHAPRALLVPAASLVLIGVLYAANFVGQGLAAGQMYEIRRHLDACLEDAAARARATPRTPLDSARL